MILTQGHKYHNPALKSGDCYIMYTKYMTVNFKTWLPVIIVKWWKRVLKNDFSCLSCTQGL